MLRSLYSGATGLKSHQTKLDVIGNNIANVNTTGFRSKTANFSDVLYQTAANAHPASETTATTNPYQVGLGSKISSISSTTKEGSTQMTGNQLDMRISGQANAYFVVKSGNQTYYTRDGAFGFDGERNLILRSNGTFVQGWKSETGGGATTKLQLPPPETENHKIYDIGSYFCGDINDVQTGASGEKEIQVPISGRDGSTYKITFTVEKASDTDDGAFKVTAKSVAITNIMGIEEEIKLYRDNEYTVKYDTTTGELLTVNDEAPADVELTIPGKSPLTFDFKDSYYIYPPVSEQHKALYTLNNTYDEVGTVAGYEVSGKGVIYTVFTNGNRELVGKVATASFTNPDGLLNTGDTLYMESISSGEPRLEDISKMGGTIVSGGIEMSNVDLAAQMADLIIDQRGFQANSKVITTSDEMLQTLRDLKR